MEINFATDTVLTDDSPDAIREPLSVEEIAPHFPQLEILECLGRGGMGVVYKARQKSLDRLVALKLLAPGREKDPEFASRFAREAQALAQLDHPHIVTVYDFGEANGFYYLLMEFVDGVNLRQLLRTRKLSPEEALAIVPPLCDALQFAHDRGIVHRDIKPENLLLAKDGRIKIADFGIARMLGENAPGEDERPAGTPAYMAPEQKETPSKVDSRADIYSLGVVFYEMLTGELPAGRIEPPSRKVQIDVRLDEIVLRALERTPELRFQTAAELRTNVEHVAGASQKGAPAPAKADPAPDRTWMKVLGYLLLLPGVPVALLGTIILWLVLSDPNWNPYISELIISLMLWVGTPVLLGSAMLLLWKAQAGNRRRVRPPLQGWQHAWLAQPADRRRTIIGGLAVAAVAAFLCFAWPRYEVTREGTTSIATTSFGWPKPWLQEAQVFQPQGRQYQPSREPGMLSFFIGLIGMGMWITLANLRATEHRATPQRSRNAKTIAAELLLAAMALAHAGLLVCALIPAPPILSMLMLAGLGTGVLATQLFKARIDVPGDDAGAEQAPARPVDPWPQRAMTLALVFLLIPVLVLIFHPRRSRSQAPFAATAAQSEIPHSRPMNGISRIETMEHAVYMDQSDDELIWALYYKGNFDPARSRSQSGERRDRSWYSEGNATTQSGRFFNFSRTSESPGILKINGVDYILGDGRAFELREDGTVVQHKLFPEPITLKNLPALAEKILATGAQPADGGDVAGWIKFLERGQWWNFYPVKGRSALSEFVDETGWRISIHAAKVQRVFGDRAVEVTFPADPKEHFELLAARARQEAGDKTALASWEESVKEWETRYLRREDLLKITPVRLDRRASAAPREGADSDPAIEKPQRGFAYSEAPDTGSLKAAPPSGATVILERQVALPADQRVAFEVFQSVNDAARERLGTKLIFKTPLDSALGITVRWHGYPADHPTHANTCIIDLIEPGRGTIFHRAELRYGEAVQMRGMDGAPPGKGTHSTLDRSGSWVVLDLVKVEPETPAGEPIRRWWETQAFVTWIPANQAEGKAAFQLPVISDKVHGSTKEPGEKAHAHGHGH